MPLRPLPLEDAALAYDPAWLPAPMAGACFTDMRHGLPWSVHRLQLFGREVAAPRLSCWVGDAGASYRYSGVRFEPFPWTLALAALRERLQEELGTRFNSVLANLYRDGRDGMGWHSDDERELGVEPIIASVSLGATRRFVLKHRGDPSRRLALDLPHGSLLVISGATQAHYRHALRKTTRPVGERINLTFRRVMQAPA